MIVCLKAQSITGVIEAMQPLLGPRTRITAVNGIPYWYFHGHGGRFEGATPEAPGVIRQITAIVFRSASRLARAVRT